MTKTKVGVENEKMTPRSFNTRAAEKDTTEALTKIAQEVTKHIKVTLRERVTVAEAESIGKIASMISFDGLFLNYQVMRHVADARTSHIQGRNKDGKTKRLSSARSRAVELADKVGLIGKKIADQLVEEGLATLVGTNRILLQDEIRTISINSVESMVSRMREKLKLQNPDIAISN